MMKFHKEGYVSLLLAIAVTVVISVITHYTGSRAIQIAGYIVSAFLLVVILQFFRNPSRKINYNDNSVLSPADGKVVVIEEVFEPEYFKDRRIQVSVFMSPVNVHINRMPVAGKIKYVKYHPGLYLVAWHPKSSTDNERSTIVAEHGNGTAVLFRQIAGALARRIVYYVKEGDVLKQGQEFGFIKFGSRVDIFLPPGTNIKVKLGDVVKGGITEIAGI